MFNTTPHTCCLYLYNTYMMLFFNNICQNNGIDSHPCPVGVSSTAPRCQSFHELSHFILIRHNIFCLHMQKALQLVSGCLQRHWTSNRNVWDIQLQLSIYHSYCNVYPYTHVYTNGVTALFILWNSKYISLKQHICTLTTYFRIAIIIPILVGAETYSVTEIRLQSGPSALFIFR